MKKIMTLGMVLVVATMFFGVVEYARYCAEQRDSMWFDTQKLAECYAVEDMGYTNGETVWVNSSGDGYVNFEVLEDGYHKVGEAHVKYSKLLDVWNEAH